MKKSELIRLPVGTELMLVQSRNPRSSGIRIRFDGIEPGSGKVLTSIIREGAWVRTTRHIEPRTIRGVWDAELAKVEAARAKWDEEAKAIHLQREALYAEQDALRARCTALGVDIQFRDGGAWLGLGQAEKLITLAEAHTPAKE